MPNQHGIGAVRRRGQERERRSSRKGRDTAPQIRSHLARQQDAHALALDEEGGGTGARSAHFCEQALGLTWSRHARAMDVVPGRMGEMSVLLTQTTEYAVHAAIH